MEPPGFVEGEEQIARCIGAPVQGDVHHDVVQVGLEVDFLDDGRGQRLDPVARVQRIVRIDTHAVVVADGGVFRVEDILRHRNMSVCLPVGGDGSLIYAAGVVFGPDALDGNLGPGVVRAGPQGGHGPDIDRGHLSEDEVSVHDENAFRSLLKIRLIRVDAGRRQGKDGEKGQDLFHQNRMLRLTYGIWVANTDSI